MKLSVLAFCAAGFAALAGQALAHHSFAMFDPDQLLTKEGTVKEFQWTNPHVWLLVNAPDATGKQMEWSFEMQAIAQATSGGWRKDIVKPGDKIAVDFHPLKDGSRGGELVSAVLADGRRLGAQAARLPVPKAP
ncbi:MAG TPA: DUF6152 family protein [Micropepsaceae bacterium]|nr:DUF6152 family protein [Micropepsaceae bacterium]